MFFSAGVGRSGTFCAADILSHMFRDAQARDAFLRDNRPTVHDSHRLLGICNEGVDEDWVYQVVHYLRRRRVHAVEAEVCVVIAEGWDGM